MGYWHTGYFEHHELMDEGLVFGDNIAPPSFPCEACGQDFASETDLRLHRFDDHPESRPSMLFRGRQCGPGPTVISGAVEVDDWCFINVVQVRLEHGAPMSPDEAARALSPERVRSVEVRLEGDALPRTVEVVFRQVAESDLVGVDKAAADLVHGKTLTLTAIGEFIDNTAPCSSASEYAAGVANYLYGVLGREGSPESGLLRQGQDAYRDKYQKAVHLLRDFDRPAAEAICGMVAFHHNDFATAMRKTKSERVAAVSLRLRAIAECSSWDRGDLSGLEAASLDHAFSDAPTELMIDLCAGPIDGSDVGRIERIEEAISRRQQPVDEFKLTLVAAEHYLSAQEPGAALRHAGRLRSGRASPWYAHVRERAEK